MYENNTYTLLYFLYLFAQFSELQNKQKVRKFNNNNNDNNKKTDLIHKHTNTNKKSKQIYI